MGLRVCLEHHLLNLLCLWSSFATATTTGTCIIKSPNVSNSPGFKARHGKRSPARFVAPRIYHCSAFCSWTKKARSFQSHYFRSIRSMPESNQDYRKTIELLPIVANYCLHASWLSWCSMQFAQVEPIVETDPEEKEESVWSSVCKEGWSSFYIHVSSTCAFDDLIGCIRSLPCPLLLSILSHIAVVCCCHHVSPCPQARSDQTNDKFYWLANHIRSIVKVVRASAE